MKSVNNKIKKPFISIGFGSDGKLTFNVDLNKTTKFNQEQLFQLSGVIRNVITVVNGGNTSKETQNVFNSYRRKTGIEFVPITISQLETVKEYIFKGQKLMAIKEFKDYTSSGLKQAKDFCDFLGEYVKYVK